MDDFVKKKLVEHLEYHKKGIELSNSLIQISSITEYKKLNLVIVILNNGYTLKFDYKYFKHAYKEREKL